MTKLLKKKSMILTVIAFVLALSFFIYTQDKKYPVNAVTESRTMVIDPGHGGVDSGALAIDGTRESDLNLSIALRLEALAQFCGIDTVMTRREDKSSAEMINYSEHQDLVHRADIANSLAAPVLISIHQNCYPTTQPKGAQVLYASDEESKILGNLVQTNLVSCLDPENRRLAEPASKKLYITSNVNCPAILVECGFVSNFSDIEKLKDKDYQSSVALILLGSYLQFITGGLR